MPSVLIVDDHVAVRAGLRNVLRLDPALDIVAAVEGCGEARAAAEDEPIDVALVDYHLRDGDGLTLCRELKELRPPVAALLYTAHEGQQLWVAAVLAGVDGVLGKGAPADRLVATIRELAVGKKRIPSLSQEAVRESARRVATEDLPILGMRLSGTAESEISEALGLTRDALARRIDSMLNALRPRIAPN
jgi:two-component system, NarL family, response regulator DevR